MTLRAASAAMTQIVNASGQRRANGAMAPTV